MAPKKPSSSALPIAIGNCEVVVDGKNFTTLSNQNTLQISLSRNSKVVISVVEDALGKGRNDLQNSILGENGHYFVLVNPKDSDAQSKSLLQYSKIIMNPSHLEIQKAANQGRKRTWEKLSAIKANCGIELVLDECVAILNHMRRLKRSAERAASASASHGLANTARFNASKRIPSWNCMARENSTGSLEDLADVASSLHQGLGGRNWRLNHNTYDGSDSESETAELHSWTRSGGPLMRTTSADQFVDFVQNLDFDPKTSKSMPHQQNSRVTVTPQDTNFDSESDQRDMNNRVHSITVTEGDLLQPEMIHNGIVFNVVKKGDLTPSNRSHDSENNITPFAVAECLQLERPEKETDASSASEDGGDDDICNDNRTSRPDSVNDTNDHRIPEDDDDVGP